MRGMSILAVVAIAAPAVAVAGPGEASRVTVGPGTYRPLFPAVKAEAEIAVAAFELDRDPVTNREFAAFVAARPRWRRDQVKPLFADGDYLAQWASPTDVGTAPPDAPVVRVSWFAARAYCASVGGRLPTEREWELAAAASPTVKDASRDPAWAARILAWYAEPTPAVLPDVGGGTPNAWGVRDLHGLVWEWIEDYSAALIGGEGREMFCGAGSSQATDSTAYAAFMRLAYRSALRASYTTPNLGFRCAYDLKESE